GLPIASASPVTSGIGSSRHSRPSCNSATERKSDAHPPRLSAFRHILAPERPADAALLGCPGAVAVLAAERLLSCLGTHRPSQRGTESEAMASKRNLTNPDAPDWSLSEQQLTAIDLLVTGKTMQDTANAIGVQRPTVSQWVNHHAGFQA